jgi:hypothetical protein
MLAVMQFNIWFFIAILIGLGVCGRYYRSLSTSRILLSSQNLGYNGAEEKEAKAAF